MIDSDLAAFVATFQRLRTIFPLRANPAEIDQITGLYFGVLRRHPLYAVQAGADICLTTGVHFPKPGQWLDAIPKRLGLGVPEMSPREAEEHSQAMEFGYQDEPCNCLECHASGVSHRFLRYVPDLDADDRDVRMVLAGRIVARGHWAHGEELRRFYEARDVFWTHHHEEVKRLRSMPLVSQAEIAAEDEDHSVEAALDRAAAGDRE